MKSMKKYFLLLLLLVSIVSLTIGCGNQDAKTPNDPASGDEPMKVGFIYVGPIGDAGYTYAHDLGQNS